MPPADPAAALRSGAAALGAALDAAQEQRLLDYLDLLARWNRAYNLTAVREVAEMVPRHLLDSLAVLELLKGRRVLDLGTGAGLPGLVLAVARPALEVTLLDPSLKRIRFLSNAVRELGIDNATPLRERAQTHQPLQPYDTVVSRAALGLEPLAQLSRPLLASGGRLLAMLGREPDAELPSLGGAVALRPLRVPGLDAERHAAVIEMG